MATEALLAHVLVTGACDLRFGSVPLIAANEHPDHDTIATFRRRFLKQIEALFVQVLGVAREMGVLKLGTVALDRLQDPRQRQPPQRAVV